MPKIKFITVFIFLSCCLYWPLLFANPEEGLGQTIQINTHFSSFAGKPSWLLIIRNVDSGQVSPYIYDVSREENFWLAFSYGRNYKITVSQMQLNPYGAVINNFCGLVDGRIMKGESMIITLSGDLTPKRIWSIDCHVMRYPDGNFTIVNP